MPGRAKAGRSEPLSDRWVAHYHLKIYHYPFSYSSAAGSGRRLLFGACSALLDQCDHISTMAAATSRLPASDRCHMST